MTTLNSITVKIALCSAGPALICSDEDCHAPASVVIDCSEHGYENQPFCSAHAHVEFANWMVGV